MYLSLHYLKQSKKHHILGPGGLLPGTAKGRGTCWSSYVSGCTEKEVLLWIMFFSSVPSYLLYFCNCLFYSVVLSFKTRWFIYFRLFFKHPLKWLLKSSYSKQAWFQYPKQKELKMA